MESVEATRNVYQPLCPSCFVDWKPCDHSSDCKLQIMSAVSRYMAYSDGLWDKLFPGTVTKFYAKQLPCSIRFENITLRLTLNQMCLGTWKKFKQIVQVTVNRNIGKIKQNLSSPKLSFDLGYNAIIMKNHVGQPTVSN